MRIAIVMTCAVWSLGAADSEPFHFEAREGATLGDVATAASEWSGRSYLLPAEAAARPVRGRVYGLKEADIVTVIGHWSGLRHQEIGGAVFFGSEDKPAVVSLPSYGLQPQAVQQVLGATASAVGDRLLVKATKLEADELRRNLEPLAGRESVTLELFGLVANTNELERVNPYLERFAAGVRYREGLPTVESVVDGSSMGPGLRGVVDIALFVRLLEDGAFGRIEMRQQVQVLSGSKSRFESGQVVETELITREPETGNDLVSRIERRTVGLIVSLQATRLEGQWSFNIDVDDGGFVGTTEVKTLYTGERLVVDGEDWFLLASYQRAARETVKRGVSGLSKVPLIGKAFRRSDGASSQRSVLLLARVVKRGGVLGAFSELPASK